MNNILIISFKDRENEYYSFPLDTSEESALKMALSNGEEGQFLSHQYIRNSAHSLDHYKNGSPKDKLDEKKLAAQKRIGRIKEYRNAFLQLLDVEFLKSLELDDPALKNHIIKLKSHLRDLPQFLKFNIIEKIEDIFRYNPFNNITGIILLATGENYTSPPTIKIESPSGKYYGFSPKATCFIKDGRVVKIEVTEFGCGYDKIPKIEIEPPKDKDGNIVSGPTAIAVCAPIELPIDF
jgi:hypothetical protein